MKDAEYVMRRIVIIAIIVEACLIILPELTRRAAREENRPEILLLRKNELIVTGVRSAQIAPGGVRTPSKPELTAYAQKPQAASGTDIYARHEIPTYVKSELLGYENRGNPSAHDALFFMPILTRFGIRIPVDKEHFIDAWNSGRLFDFNEKIYLTARESGVGFVFRLN
jgi:hypothetical protein